VPPALKFPIAIIGKSYDFEVKIPKSYSQFLIKVTNQYTTPSGKSSFRITIIIIYLNNDLQKYPIELDKQMYKNRMN
jgi:hypothetical protein